jgi:hypothetical protein
VPRTLDLARRVSASVRSSFNAAQRHDIGRARGDWHPVRYPVDPGRCGSPVDFRITGRTKEDLDMTEKTSGLGESVRNGIVGAIRAGGDVTGVTMEVVNDAVGALLEDAGRAGSQVTETIGDIAGGAVRGARSIGGSLAEASKGIVIGALLGSRQIGIEATITISEISAAVIRSVASVGGELGHAAVGPLDGAILSARGIGVSAEDAASAAALGALNGADEVGGVAVYAVHDALIRRITAMNDGRGAPSRSYGLW